MGRFVIFVIAFAVFVAVAAPSRDKDDGSASNQSSSIEVASASSSSWPGSSSASPSQSSSTYGETRLSRDGSGQFHVDARLNGQTMPFLVDTGADTVAITVDDARRLGIYVNPYEFQPVGTGAGGALKGQVVTVNQMEVAGRTLSNVHAVVIEGLETNLLGQSVLREFGKVELSGDTMVIRS